MDAGERKKEWGQSFVGPFHPDPSWSFFAIVWETIKKVIKTVGIIRKASHACMHRQFVTIKHVGEHKPQHRSHSGMTFTRLDMQRGGGCCFEGF